MVGRLSEGHPEHELLQLEESERLLAIIRDLSSERQQLLILKFVEHLSNAEIGQIMGRTEGAVKSLYHRTLLSLRNEYGLPGDELPLETDAAPAGAGNLGAKIQQA
jgi:RNA polymerase sigma-70 factor (ECF subfamily)